MRDIKDLHKEAVLFWPEEITKKEKASSVIPKLIDSQEIFISILSAADKNYDSWLKVLEESNMDHNFFLKHLQVLSDIGGEKLMRFHKEFPPLFPDNKMEFVWKGNSHIYKFKSLGEKKTWSNKNLKLDGAGLLERHDFNPMMLDVSFLLLFGGLCTNNLLPHEVDDKCIIGSMLGNPKEIGDFVRKRYIWVSRITGGASANAMGQLVEKYAVEKLQKFLPDWRFNKDQLPDVSHNERTKLSVDIVGKSPSGKYCAIEVSFQVTTNSTIERKAGQAKSRQELLHAKGHRIAYIIDGAGNFQRESALTAICQYSDCTVTLKEGEIKKLVTFLIEFEKEI